MRHSDSATWSAYLADPRVIEHTSFPELTLTLVEAFVMTTNVPSIRLLEAVGFAREGTLHGYRVARGVPRDFHVYAVLRPFDQGSYEPACPT